MHLSQQSPGRTGRFIARKERRFGRDIRPSIWRQIPPIGELHRLGQSRPPQCGQVWIAEAVESVAIAAIVTSTMFPATLRSHRMSEEPTTALIVPKEAAPLRLDQFVARELPKFSRSRIQQLIRDKFITLNGSPARPRDTVRLGDRVEVTEPPPEKIDIEPQAIPLDVLYEDDDLIVINKSAGLVVHPGAGQREDTLVNALLHHFPKLSGIGGKERPGIVHRLDKETTGCLVVAKNDEAHRGLSAQFAERTVDKIYLALVAGRLRKSLGTIAEKIGRHPVDRQRMSVTSRRGRAAKTEYRVIRASNEMSLVECKLHSGRTHQIRVHLHHLGHPVLGDKVYGGRFAKTFSRQMLHAWKLGFRHPRSGEWKNFEAPLPADLQAAINPL
jgi:23S rRNA pseudouridine1911/1915/1917 synthase